MTIKAVFSLDGWMKLGGVEKARTLTLIRPDGTVEINWRAVEQCLAIPSHPLWSYAKVFIAIRNGTYTMMQDEP